MMKTVFTNSHIRDCVTALRSGGKSIGFVPTMGALHEGHLRLVHQSKTSGDACIMSIFVNPTQFGPNEDFNHYPRPIEKDTELAQEAGVDVLFLPSQEEIYPTETVSFIEETQFNKVFCGPYRPGHFKGVCTVVRRFLEIISPDKIYLGEKDAQQLRIIDEMIRYLHLSVQIIPVPTLRESNGLAKSSRNQYLSTTEKQKASVIYNALTQAQGLFDAGERNRQNLLQKVRSILDDEKSFKIQYVDLVAWKDFQPKEIVREKSVLAIAGFFGKTRLIDNIIVTPA